MTTIKRCIFGGWRSGHKPASELGRPSLSPLAEVALGWIFNATRCLGGRSRSVTSFISRRLDRTAFPHRVLDLPELPRELHLTGELPRGPSAAIIGTRHPTEEAVKYTFELVRWLGRHGLSIWSGGAKGIDIAAHRAAVQAGATTVVVAPAGWERPYPPEHAEDFRAVVEHGGAYLSLVPPAQEARLHQFFARNALLMTLVDVVVIVQAGLRSGARNAAKVARRLGRTIFVAPSCPWVHQGLGCNLEIGLGARVLLSPKEVVKATSGYGISCVAVLEAHQVEPCHVAPSVTASQQRGQAPQGPSRMRSRTVAGSMSHSDPALDAELRLVVAAVVGGARHVDALCERTGLSLSVVQSDLLRLTLMGLVRTDHAGAIDLVSD